MNISENISDLRAFEFCYLPTLWPDLCGFQTAWRTYYGAMEDLAYRIMAAFGEALDLPSSYFDTFISQPISALRALYYPPTGAHARVGQHRAGAHKVYGSLTILMPESRRSGL